MSVLPDVETLPGTDDHVGCGVGSAEGTYQCGKPAVCRVRARCFSDGDGVFFVCQEHLHRLVAGLLSCMNCRHAIALVEKM